MKTTSRSRPRKPKRPRSRSTRQTAVSERKHDDLPVHAKERLADMREKQLFTSDLSVSEFVLVREAGFDPVGMVMGTSIYQIAPKIPADGRQGELVETSKALYHARELAMNRMEAEAEALGADGIVGVRL